MIALPWTIVSMNREKKDWNEFEVNACVASYLEHLVLDIQGQHFVKAQLYRDLAKTIPRTEKSIEFKFQNISAVLNELGLEWIGGLAPLRNYQKSLALAVEEQLPNFLELKLLRASSGFEDMASVFVEAAPERASKPSDSPEYVKTLVRKFDPIERDRKNAILGAAGEEFAFKFERHVLSAHNRADLARRVRWVSKEDGDGAGYDILSFDPDGQERFVEVKTTYGGNRTPFYISRNETEFSREAGDRFKLFRLYNFRREPKAFEMIGSVDKYVRLTAEQYRADFEA